MLTLTPSTATVIWYDVVTVQESLWNLNLTLLLLLQTLLLLLLLLLPLQRVLPPLLQLVLLLHLQQPSTPFLCIPMVPGRVSLSPLGTAPPLPRPHSPTFTWTPSLFQVTTPRKLTGMYIPIRLFQLEPYVRVFELVTFFFLCRI